jgi:FSR family fosmidomycin resistance protein-like MFS transporter
LVYGAREAAWPLIQRDLHLGIVAIGALLAVPVLVGMVLEPPIGLLADAGHRRRLILAGGVVFGGALVMVALATGFLPALLGFALLSPASGAFVSLSQATLMDTEPETREANMVRWTLAGSIGVVAGPLMITAAIALGLGWRPAFLLGAVLTLMLLPLLARGGHERVAAVSLRDGLRGALRALTAWRVVRWLVLLECGDMTGDILNGYLALYMVDVTHVPPVQAGLAVAVLTGASLVGDALLLPLTQRVPGMVYLGRSAAIMIVLYPAFLVVPGFAPKLAMLGCIGLLRAGWYAIPQARLYDEIPETSGSMLVLSNAGAIVAALVPFGFALVAGTAGFGIAMWLLTVGPLSVFLLTRSFAGLNATEEASR